MPNNLLVMCLDCVNILSTYHHKLTNNYERISIIWEIVVHLLHTYTKPMIINGTNFSRIYKYATLSNGVVFTVFTKPTHTDNLTSVHFLNNTASFRP